MFAKLEFGDNASEKYVAPQYNVVNYNSVIMRTHDCCLPHANPRCETFEIVINTPDKADLNLIEWYIEGCQKSGKITFDLESNETGDESRKSVVYFEDAYCSAISEHYDIDEKAVRQLKLMIVPMSLNVCDIDFVRHE